MDVQLKRGLLDICVLAAIKNEDSYGYQIIKDMKPYVDISESTLYPVLRRLQKNGHLEVYDMECAGRNRRYYRTTPQGEMQLKQYRSEWMTYSKKITEIFEGGKVDE